MVDWPRVRSAGVLERVVRPWLTAQVREYLGMDDTDDDSGGGEAAQAKTEEERQQEHRRIALARDQTIGHGTPSWDPQPDPQLTHADNQSRAQRRSHARKHDTSRTTRSQHGNGATTPHTI